MCLCLAAARTGAWRRDPARACVRQLWVYFGLKPKGRGLKHGLVFERVIVWVLRLCARAWHFVLVGVFKVLGH